MKRSLTEAVKQLAIEVTEELKKNPAAVTAGMLMALCGCADVLEGQNLPVLKKEMAEIKRQLEARPESLVLGNDASVVLNSR